jgi:uncharacterized membrane protein
MVFRFATVQGLRIEWFLRRNCALTPVQLSWFYLSLCMFSLVIGVAFWFMGAVFVLPFASLELLLVGICFLVYARHASDGERIYLDGGRLVVELENAGRLERKEFRREWVRVEPRSGDGSLIEVSGQGLSVFVGRFVRPELRPVLANEIRMALRSA